MKKTLESLKKEKTALAERVALYVPGTIDVDHAADNKKYVEHVASAFSAWFGGATASNASGYWLSDAAGLVREGVTIVYSYTTKSALEDRLEDVVALAEQIRAELRQEAVSIELNNTLYLI